MKAFIGGLLAVCAWSVTAGKPALAQELLCKGDQNRDGQVSIAELVSAVNMALNGCRGCVDISGVWDLTEMNCLEPFTFEFELTINPVQSDCGFDGTIKILTSPRPDEIGHISPIIMGTMEVTGELAFVRDLPLAEGFIGNLLGDGQTMGGVVGPCNWFARRR